MSTRFRCFVIMPYSQESDSLYRTTILPVLRNLPGSGVLVLRADEMGERPVTLKAHVETAVQSADFCIADLSGLNPNVLYELGYATARGKPVVTIMARDSGRLPANLAESQVLYYSPNDLTTFRSSLARKCSQIVTRIQQAQETKEIESDPSKSVLAEPVISLAFDRLVQSVELTFSALVGSPSPLVKILLPKLRQRMATIQRGTILVVCANPEGNFAEARASILDRSLANYRQEMWAAVNQLRTEFESMPGWNAELRFTDEIVPSSIYLSDSMALFIPYLFAARSRQSLTVMFDKSQNLEMFTLLQRQFDQIWSSATHSRQILGRSVFTLSDEDA